MRKTSGDAKKSLKNLSGKIAEKGLINKSNLDNKSGLPSLNLISQATEEKKVQPRLSLGLKLDSDSE